MKPIKSPILNVVSQLTITMPRKKSITPSKISLLTDDPGDPDDSSKSDSDSSTDSQIISPPKKPAVVPAPSSKLPISNLPSSSQPRIVKSKSKLPLPPVPVPDWAKPPPKPGVRRALNFDDAAGSSSSPTSGSSSPKPVDPVSDPKIPIVDEAAEASTGARRKDTAPAPKRVMATSPLSVAMKSKRKRVTARYSDEDTK